MDKFVDLQFLGRGELLDIHSLHIGAIHEHMDKCVSVLRLPAAEMLAYTPTGIARELFWYTSSADWHSKLRRMIKPGDMFTFYGEPWVFVPKQCSALPIQPYKATFERLDRQHGGITYNLNIFNPILHTGLLL